MSEFEQNLSLEYLQNSTQLQIAGMQNTTQQKSMLGSATGSLASMFGKNGAFGAGGAFAGAL